MNTDKQIVIIAPHPDDEILGCGGSIIKAIEKGYECCVVYLSSGDSDQQIREVEAKKAGDFMGIKKQYFLNFEKTGFNVNLENISKIKKILLLIKPYFIFINHENDGDREHKIAYKLVSESFWRYNLEIKTLEQPKGLILYEIHRPMQKHNLVENISREIDKKMKALSFYKSQINEKNRIDLAMKGLNRYRGSMHNGIEFAEYFQIKWWQELFT